MKQWCPTLVNHFGLEGFWLNLVGVEAPIQFMCNNKPDINIDQNPVQHDSIKHV